MINPDDKSIQSSDTCSGVYPAEEFEGLLEERWSNGSLKYRGVFRKNLKRIGQHLSFWQSGALQEVSFWDDGWVCGTVLWFREDGSKESEKDYGEFGGRTRCWTERTYGSNSDLYWIRVWANGDVIAEWLHPEMRKLLSDTDTDSVVADAVRLVYPDAKVESP